MYKYTKVKLKSTLNFLQLDWSMKRFQKQNMKILYTDNRMLEGMLINSSSRVLEWVAGFSNTYNFQIFSTIQHWKSNSNAIVGGKLGLRFLPIKMFQVSSVGLLFLITTTCLRLLWPRLWWIMNLLLFHKFRRMWRRWRRSCINTQTYFIRTMLYSQVSFGLLLERERECVCERERAVTSEHWIQR